MLGIGLWGNKEARPRWKSQELATSLVKVILGPESESISRRAAELAKQFPEDAGRNKVASEILNALGPPQRRLVAPKVYIA